MTAIPSVLFHNMDSLEPGDTMDLATSPYHQEDDLDLDIDPMRETSPEPNLESMFEDTFEDHTRHFDTMEDDPYESVQDNDMIDDDTVIHHPMAANDDFNIEALPQDEAHLVDDEDILYEDEEEEAQENLVQISKPQHEPASPNSQQETSSNHGNLNQTRSLELEQDRVTDHETDQHTGRQTDTEISREHQGYNQVNDDVGQEPSGGNDELATALDEDHPPKNAYIQVESEAPPTSVVEIDILENDGQPVNQDAALEVETDIRIHPAPSAAAAQETITEETKLHTVKVIYQESEMCLFPPTHSDNSDTFFLSDIHLAYETFDKLLASCREILAGTIGDDDELVLDVASLGLHICEDSKYATQFTLSEILDVYLALSHNEKIENVEPLYCTLTSRVCLASQYAYLTASAQEGKTFTDISMEHLGSPDESTYASESEYAPPNQEPISQEQYHSDALAISGEDEAHVNHEGKHDEVDEHFYLPDEDQEHTSRAHTEPGASADHDGDHSGSFLEQDQSITSLAHVDEPVFGGPYEISWDDEAKARENKDGYTVDVGTDHLDDIHVEPASPDFSESVDPAEDFHGTTDELEFSNKQESVDLTDSNSAQDDTNSSHTVEGDENNLPHSHEDFKTDSLDHDPPDQTEPGPPRQDPATLDAKAFFDEDDEPEGNKSEHATASDDDILDLEIDKQDEVEHSGILVEEDDEPEDLFSETETVDNSETPVAGASSTNPTNGHSIPRPHHPSTPSKSKTSKRKVADDEDVLDFLDLDTPDVKRRRPS